MKLQFNLIRQLGVFALGTLAALAACAAPTALPPTTISVAPTVLVPFTPSTPDLQLPTLLPTVVVPTTPAAPTPLVLVVTATPAATASAGALTPTRPRPAATAAVTAAVTKTPFPEGVPKVYVTALSVSPATPKASVPGTFAVTFQNVSGQDQGYNWCVEIWQADNVKKPFGLTTCQNSTMPVGVSHLTSTGWLVKGLGECTPYRARVVARDPDDNRSNFVQPDGTILWLDFGVCP
jgi:hypothetical protein